MIPTEPPGKEMSEEEVSSTGQRMDNLSASSMKPFEIMAPAHRAMKAGCGRYTETIESW